MRHGDPTQQGEPLIFDLELGNVDVDMTPFLIRDRKCKCEGLCKCEKLFKKNFT